MVLARRRRGKRRPAQLFAGWPKFRVQALACSSFRQPKAELLTSGAYSTLLLLMRVGRNLIVVSRKSLVETINGAAEMGNRYRAAHH
jgi:hypothetical protein